MFCTKLLIYTEEFRSPGQNINGWYNTPRQTQNNIQCMVAIQTMKRCRALSHCRENPVYYTFRISRAIAAPCLTCNRSTMHEMHYRLFLISKTSHVFQSVVEMTTCVKNKLFVCLMTALCTDSPMHCTVKITCLYVFYELLKFSQDFWFKFQFIWRTFGSN